MDSAKGPKIIVSRGRAIFLKLFFAVLIVLLALTYHLRHRRLPFFLLMLIAAKASRMITMATRTAM